MSNPVAISVSVHTPTGVAAPDPSIVAEAMAQAVPGATVSVSVMTTAVVTSDDA